VNIQARAVLPICFSKISAMDSGVEFSCSEWWNTSSQRTLSSSLSSCQCLSCSACACARCQQFSSPSLRSACFSSRLPSVVSFSLSVLSAGENVLKLSVAMAGIRPSFLNTRRKSRAALSSSSQALGKGAKSFADVSASILVSWARSSNCEVDRFSPKNRLAVSGN
jgi:hypothetical protein